MADCLDVTCSAARAARRESVRDAAPPARELEALLPPLDRRSGPARRLSTAASARLVQAIVDQIV